MRIIYYSPHPTHDIVSEVGYSTHQREMIIALRQLGHEVITVIMGGDNPKDHGAVLQKKTKSSLLKKALKAVMPGFIWTTLNNHKLLRHDRMAGNRLEQAILTNAPDLIYERSEYLQDSGAKMAQKYKIRYFLEVNAPFVEEMRHFEGYSLYQGRGHRIEKFKLEKAWKVFSVSSALSEFLIKQYNCAPGKIILQPNCISLDKLKEIGPKNIDLATYLKINLEKEKVIGFVGSIFPYHGVDLLIKAFASVFKTHSSIKLLIVGDGTIVPELKMLSFDLGVKDHVIFAGKIPHKEVFRYMNLMDICVMAKSNWYGSPVKIFEYGLMHKPIIAPNTLPVKDVMQNLQSGLLIDDQESELVSAIETYLNDTQLAGSCASSFHAKVLDQYTWQKAAERIIKECA